MSKACIIGWPVAHSRSPLIHGYWLRKYGSRAAMTDNRFGPTRSAEFLAGMPALGLVGCNVTLPHKEAAFAAAARRNPGGARHRRRQHALV